MANFFAPEVAGLGTVPTSKSNGAVHGGRLRRFRATVNFASQASGDTITLAQVPAGYVFAYGIVNAGASFGASATIAIGTAGAGSGKYRAAAVQTTTGPVLFGTNTAADDVPLAAEETVVMTIAVAALPASGSAVVDLYFSAP